MSLDGTTKSVGAIGAPLRCRVRARLLVEGVVQGVGFRPFVYALARGLAVSGSVSNSHRVDYEAEAAMRFEELARSAVDGPASGYSFALDADVLDPRPVLAAAAADVLAGRPAALIAARFHRGVAAAVSRCAQQLRERTGLDTVALTGGVFLNVLLTELCCSRLEEAGFRVLTHRQVPPSDAGLALGQLVVGARKTEANNR